MAKKKKSLFQKVGISWATMKLGRVEYTGTYTGAKANVCRANRTYKPKRWRTLTDPISGIVFIERYE